MNDKTTTEQKLWRLEQGRLIEETLLDYAFYVDRNDPTSLAEKVFCEDGRFELGSQHAVQGRKNLALMFARTLSKFSATSHHVSNVRVRISSNTTATASAYVYAWHAAAEDGQRIDLWGRYHDDLRLTPGGWRIAARRLTVVATDGWTDPPFELVDRLPNSDDTPPPKVTRI